MDINYLFSNQFRVSENFSMFSTMQRNQVNCFQIHNQLFDDVKSQGLELHYEVQINDDDMVDFYLDCHVYPYHEFKNNGGDNFAIALKKYYSEEKADKILKLREDLKKIYLDLGKTKDKDNKYSYGAYNTKNYLRLVSCEGQKIENEVQLLAEIYKFIGDTYPQLIEALQQANIID